MPFDYVRDIKKALKKAIIQEIEKQKTELYASLKIKLEQMWKDITSHVNKSNFKLKTQYLKDKISSNKVELVAIKVDLEKG